MIIEWDDTYSIGIDELDNHHRNLIQLLNRSYFLILQGSDLTELSLLLGELIKYAQYHFAAEEELMRQHQYTHLDRHVSEHYSFTDKLLSFTQEMADGKRCLSIEIFEFIRNWLLDHILKIDSEMGKTIACHEAP